MQMINRDGVIRDRVHLGWCPFGIVFIGDGTDSGWCPFRIVCLFRDRVYLGNCQESVNASFVICGWLTKRDL